MYLYIFSIDLVRVIYLRLMINRSRARLVGMTNVCESLINIVNRIKRNVIVTLKPKGMWQVILFTSGNTLT